MSLCEFHGQVGCNCNEENRAYLQALESERDKLKAELEWTRKEHATFRDDMAKLNDEIGKDRDHWKTLAGKMAEYLDVMRKHEEIQGFDSNPAATMHRLAKEALDAYQSAINESAEGRRGKQ